MGVPSLNMKATPIAVAALIVGAVFFSPVTAQADDSPLEPWTADQAGEPYLDCDAAMWYVDVDHYYADQLEPGVYSAPIITSTTTEEWGGATGDAMDSDCPNWITDEDGNWYNSDAHGPETNEPPAGPPVHPLPPVDHPHGKSGLQIVWKVGLAR